MERSIECRSSSASQNGEREYHSDEVFSISDSERRPVMNLGRKQNLMKYLIVLFWGTVFAFNGNASDRIFRDIEAQSPSGEWRLDARSPDNKIDNYQRWQDDFVYTMRKGGQVVWQREQSVQQPSEHSPVRVFVNDNGFAAIHTGRDELIFVDSQGRNCGRIDDLTNLLPATDHKEFVLVSSVGLLWTPYSIWHFVEVEEKSIFVIRLWWGRLLVFEPENGMLIVPDDIINTAIHEWQVEHCRSWLAEGTSKELDKDSAAELITPALLAGQLGVRDAIPRLRVIEQSEHIRIYREWRDLDIKSDSIDRFIDEQFLVRQIAQLSLRRLGESPEVLPIFEPPKRDLFSKFRLRIMIDREKNEAKLTQGMSPMQVVELIGLPDFIGRNEWSYDFEKNTPRSLMISWDSYVVKDIERSEPLWKKVGERESVLLGK